jgi:hypothetical protein
MEITGLAIASDIDEVVLINVDAVFSRWPNTTILRATLRFQEAGIARR